MEQSMFDEFDRQLNEKLTVAEKTVADLENDRQTLDNAKQKANSVHKAKRKTLTADLNKARANVRECDRRLGNVRPRSTGGESA